MMKKFFNKNRTDIFFILIIVILSTIIRIYLLGKIPTNINGDEVTILSDVYRILFAKGDYLFSLMSDSSTVGIVLYWYAFWIKLFGFDRTIFALRFSTTFISIFSLILFFLILKNKTSSFIAFIFTILLSGNYVFLNFSRTAWVNITSVFFGLAMIFFIEKAEKDKKADIWYIVAGFFAGISLYGYAYSRVLVPFTILYLTSKFIYKKNRTLIYAQRVLLFCITAFLAFFPFVIRGITTNSNVIFTRPSATYAFSKEKVEHGNSKQLIIHQAEYTLRGFLLLDGKVMNEGVENMRYLPMITPPVDILIKCIFILSLLYGLFKFRKNSIWIYILISILLTQFLSELPPNFSRGIFYIVLIYLACGVFIYNLLFYFTNFYKIQKYKNFIYISSVIFALAIFSYNVNLYFNWMREPYEYNARQPAIEYKEFDKWQNYQIKRVREGQLPVTNYEWYSIRDSIK